MTISREEKDVLFLCWSKAAVNFEQLNKEWKYVCEMKGEEFVEPIAIDSSKENSFSFKLLQKYFHDKTLYIIKLGI